MSRDQNIKTTHGGTTNTKALGIYIPFQIRRKMVSPILHFFVTFRKQE